MEHAPPSWLDSSAAEHGRDLLKNGSSVDQVVHDYGDICQAITELALDEHDSIATGDFHTLNRIGRRASSS